MLAAANEMTAAFAESRIDDYFDCFVPDASFVFHTTTDRLESRAAYREVWRRWVTEDDLRVVTCVSSHQMVQLLGGNAAVFTHDVETVLESKEGGSIEHERETIVFTREVDGRWLAVHEHVSPDPAFTTPR